MHVHVHACCTASHKESPIQIVKIQNQGYFSFLSTRGLPDFSNFHLRLSFCAERVGEDVLIPSPLVESSRWIPSLSLQLPRRESVNKEDLKEDLATHVL